MILDELIDELKTAIHPMANALHAGNHFRVIIKRTCLKY